MKKSYSVKEAAGLLGVSTNTIYTYLKEGKLIARRIGMGRFKIPYMSLAPFLELGKQYSEQDMTNTGVEPHQDVNNERIGIMGLESDSFRDNQIDTEKENHKVLSLGVNDIAFYRLFKAVMFLGAGFSYLIMEPLRVFTTNIFDKRTDEILVKILPFALIISGLFALIGIIYHSKLKLIQSWIRVFTVMVLGYYTLVALLSGEYGLLIFSGSLLSVTVLRFLSGVTKDYGFTFFSQFSRYSIFLVVIGGIVILLFPGIFPIENLAGLINANKGLSALMWFGLLIPILTILMNNGGKPTYLLAIYFSITGAIAIIFANQLTLQADWDVSYLSFTTGIFALFFAVWHIFKINLDIRRIHIFTTSFIWIALSCVLGLSVIRYSQEQKRGMITESVNLKLEETVTGITNFFENQEAVLVASASDPEVVESLRNNNTILLSSKAKELYEKVGASRRVLFYDAYGQSVGIYPHMNLGLGTDFSEREYFQKTKSTYKGYISNVFEDILGINTVTQTEPIFYNNRFIGMVGIAVSLDGLSDKYQKEIGQEFNYQVLDENSVVVIASDREKIGTYLYREDIIRNYISDNQIIWTYQPIRNPSWELYVNIPIASVIKDTSNFSTITFLLIIFNAVFSTWIALVLALNGKSVKLGKPQAFSFTKALRPM